MKEQKKRDLSRDSSLLSYQESKDKYFKKNVKTKDKVLYFLHSHSAYLFLPILLFPLFVPEMIYVCLPALIILIALNKAHSLIPEWTHQKPVYHDNKKSKVKLFFENVSPPYIEKAYRVALSIKAHTWDRLAMLGDSKKNYEGGKGIICFGNDVDKFDKSVWFSKEELQTHILLLGTTGSGKTQTILSFLYQFLAQGSGYIFVDAKGDITTWFYIFSMARSLGLEDNLTVINYITAGISTTGKLESKRSNTINLFQMGSSESLMELLSSMKGGSSGGSDDMWSQRADALGRSVLRALVELRDMGDIVLGVDTIREHLVLSEVEKLAQDERLSDLAKTSLKSYLAELPGWAESLNDGPQAEHARQKAGEQHNYLTMQFTYALEMLSGTYSYIAKTDVGEINFKDVIANRRLVYIMLPSMEKSPDSLKALAKLIITNIRSALTNLMRGEKLTGSKSTLLDARPTNSPIPYPMVFDEYGSYAVEGFGDVAAQARSLGVCCLFAGQDIASFEKAGREEAKRIFGNTNIKMFMKLEDEDSANMAKERGGTAYIYQSTGAERKEGKKGFYESRSYRLDSVERIDPKELVGLQAGEAYICYGKDLWKVKTFYGDFPQYNESRVNTFLKVRTPKLDKDGEYEDVVHLSELKYWRSRLKKIDSIAPEKAISTERYFLVKEFFNNLSAVKARFSDGQDAVLYALIEATKDNDRTKQAQETHELFEEVKNNTGMDVREVLHHMSKEKSYESHYLSAIREVAEQKNVDLDAWDDSHIDQLYDQPKNIELAMGRCSTLQALTKKTASQGDKKFLAVLDKIRAKNEASPIKKLLEKYQLMVRNQRVDHWSVFPDELNDVRKKFSDDILEDYPLSPLPNKAGIDKVKELQKYIEEVGDD